MGDLAMVNICGDREVVDTAKPGARAVGVLFLQRASSFLLPGESYSLLNLKRLGATR